MAIERNTVSRRQRQAKSDRRRNAAVLWLSLLLITAFTASPAAAAVGTQITITSSVGVPDRGDTNLAIDGDTGTDTYTTPINTTDFPSYLEFGFASAQVNRIRLYKDSYVAPHSLIIQYTTDTGDLTLRSWTNVSGLVNGFNGQELMNATSVNSDGTVTGDNHDSVLGGDGWASLTFDPVTATGLRISFVSSDTFNHYHVYEFEAWLSPYLFSIDRGTNCTFTCSARLYMIDPLTGAQLGSIGLNMPGYQLNCSQNGLAADPGTGTLFATVWPDSCQGNSRLVTIDPDTGSLTDIGDLGEKFATLTFFGSTLYGATGNTSNNVRTLFTIDTGTAVATPVCVLNNTINGQALGASDTLLYHASYDRNSATQIFESIDPGSLPVDPSEVCPASGISGDLFSEPSALVRSDSDFLLASTSTDFMELTEGGSVSSLGYLPHVSKGLAFAASSPRHANLHVNKIGARMRQSGQRYIVYTITVTNDGPAAADNVTIQDGTGAYQAYYSDDSGCSVDNGPVTCNVGTLGSGSQATVKITVTLNSPGKVRSVNNSVVVSGEVFETDLSDNYTTVSVSTKGK